MPTINDIYSRHAHYLEQYYNDQSDRLLPYLRRVTQQLRYKLTQTNTVTSQARIKSLLEFTEDLVKGELVAFTDELNTQIEMFAVQEAEFAAATVGKVSDFEMVIPAPAQLSAAVNARPFNNLLLKDYLKDFSVKQSKAVRDAVSMGFYEGQTTAEIVRGIVGTKAQNYKNGILNVTRTNAERMVRTALSHTASVAKNKTFEDNIDVIPYYEWVSTLDGRTSPTCQSRDGKVWKVGKGPMPPAHYNCRSTTTPLFEDEVTSTAKGFNKKNIGGKRASMDGPVKADQTYNDWLGKQSKAFQVDVLGKKKAELFRKGGLSLDKFVNERGQALTLDQLKAKHPSAWDKT